METNVRRNILEVIRELSTPAQPVYLVGGGVRDALLDRPAHDLDFVLPGETRALAREAARRLRGAFYVLDEERDTTRVVLGSAEDPENRLMLDFASLRAADLESDLRDRDFTINAMAYDVARPDHLIDPTGGLADLREGRIRACSAGSLSRDPVRVLRAIRQALSFHFKIDPRTLDLIRAAAPHLTQPSAERLRDELFRMLDGNQVALAVRLLDQVGALAYVLPEMEALKGVTQTAPHVSDAWEHTLSVVQHLDRLFALLVAPLVGEYEAGAAADITAGSAVLWLGRYRDQLAAHYRRRLVPDRTLRSLLFFAALYHDIGKPITRTVSADGRVRFLQHQDRGAEIAAERARALTLSVLEVNRIATIIDGHMRVHFLANIPGSRAVRPGGQNDAAPNVVPRNIVPPPLDTAEPDGDALSRRSIYRFFHATGDAGVDVCLLSLADLRGTYETTLPQDTWQAELETCRALLEAYWEKSEEVVSPPRYLTGNDLMAAFGLKPGRLVGRLLAAIREAQAAGEIHDREGAWAYARRWIEQKSVSKEISGDEGEG